MSFDMTMASARVYFTMVPDYKYLLERGLKPVKVQLQTYPLASLLAFIFIFILANIVRSIATRYLHLSQFQGPPWAAFTRLWLCKTLASGESARRFVEVNQKYGSLARIGPNHLITDDPEFTRKILAARSRYTRGPWFDSIKIDPHVPNIVSERHPGRHNHLRHQMAGGYAGKEIEGAEEAVDQRIGEFIQRIEERWLSDSDGTAVFDIARRIQFLAVDVITHLCFGKPLGFIESDSDVFNFLATIEMQLPIVQHFSVILEFNNLLLQMVNIPFLKRLIVPSSSDKKGIGMIMGVCKYTCFRRDKG